MSQNRLLSYLAIASMILAAGICHAQNSGGGHRVPMEEQFENSMMRVWFDKKVHDSRLIHDMEAQTGWSVRGIGEISFTQERSIDGTTSLRFRTQMWNEEAIRRNASENGTFSGSGGGGTSATLTFDQPQDWTNFNRIALWVYVHPTEIRKLSFTLRFRCANAPETITSPKYDSVIQNLEPGRWNRVIFEIPGLTRDKVTELVINQGTFGHDPEVDGTVTYDIDNIEIQRVDAEKFEGWDVAPGKIAFNHVGYKPEQNKTAIAADLPSQDFQLVEASTGRPVITRPVNTLATKLGTFDVLDFSDVRKPGRYFLRAGTVESRPFIIADTLWRQAIYKAINFFYCERCGYDVPGVHRECHRDWQGVHNGEKKIINGGWHDAGDLSQGSFRTGMAVYAMLDIVDQLNLRGADPELAERVLEEALWGLDWLLKTRFGGGFRMTWSTMRIYTDCKIGTIDDVITPAQNTPWENFLAAAVEARTYQTLREKNPALASQCLAAAIEDWEAAVYKQPDWERGHDTYLAASWGVTSSILLYRGTGNETYAERAEEYGRLLLSCQERRFRDGIPITGYFYTNPEGESILHHSHAAFEESPLIALKELCDTFPGNEDWMEWYGAAVLHSEYFLKRGAEYSAPYFVLPNSVYRKSELMRISDEKRRNDMLKQFYEGTRFTDEYVLRIFPIWTDNGFHGNTGVHLSTTMALVQAILLRGDLNGEALAHKQFQWVFGGNSFSQSLMYGEGYDYMPQYAYSPGDIVGSLPVGMDCMNNDEPYWYGTNTWTYKEIWVVPVSRFLWNAAALAIPAFVQGRLDDLKSGAKDVTFFHRGTGETLRIPVNDTGTFKNSLPAGTYDVSLGAARQTLTVVSGGTYSITLSPENCLQFSAGVSSAGNIGNTIQIEASAEGKGVHTVSLRLFNAHASQPAQAIDLAEGTKAIIRWDITVDDPDAPWVAIIIPDGDMTGKQELTGTLGGR